MSRKSRIHGFTWLTAVIIPVIGIVVAVWQIYASTPPSNPLATSLINSSEKQETKDAGLDALNAAQAAKAKGNIVEAYELLDTVAVGSNTIAMQARKQIKQIQQDLKKRIQERIQERNYDQGKAMHQAIQTILPDQLALMDTMLEEEEQKIQQKIASSPQKSLCQKAEFKTAIEECEKLKLEFPLAKKRIETEIGGIYLEWAQYLQKNAKENFEKGRWTKEEFQEFQKIASETLQECLRHDPFQRHAPQAKALLQTWTK